MADEILSTLGFKCDDAIAALEKMDQKMNAMAGTFGSLTEAMSDWNASAAPTIECFKAIAEHANNAAAAVAKLNANMRKTGGSGQAAPPPPPPPPEPSKQLWLPPGVKEEIEAIKPPIKQVGEELDKTKAKAGGFTVSLQMLSRIVITQAIVRAISGIRDAISEAITSNMEFQKRISELNSIMAGPKENMDGLKSSVAALAVEFNFPISQVAEAEYQAVSAQFTSTAQRADIMTASLKLAKIGCMELSTATTLIAATLNSYGMSSSQAETVAGKFFQTIQDGKVRGEELASSLGKVMPVASELGVSIDEVTTAIVQLTVAGVKAPEASTSLRSALMALIKPSADLKKELRELGFDSGEQIVAAYGLSGALDKLRDSTDGTIQSAVKLFPNIRAQNTILRETGDYASKTAKELEKMRAANAESLNKAYKIFIDTNAEKVSADLNKLKVWMTTDLGPTLVNAVAGFLSMTGGVGTLTSAINALVGPLAAAGALFVTYIAYCKASAFATELLAGKITLLGAAAGAATMVLAAYAAISLVNEKNKASLDQALQEFDRTTKEINDKKDAARRAELQAMDQMNEAIVQNANQQVAAIAAGYNKQIDIAKTADAELVAETKSTMESLISAKEKGVNLLKDLVKEADKEIQNSLKRSAEIKTSMEDMSFDFAQKHDNKGDYYHQKEDESRAMQLARQGASQLANAKSPEEEQVAQSTIKRAEAYGKMAMAAAQKLGTLSAEREAEGYLLSIQQERLKGEERFRALKDQQAMAAREAQAKEQADANQMRTLMKKIVEESSTFDKKGDPIDAKKRKENLENVAKDMASFEKLAFGTGNWDVSKYINFTEFRTKMMDNMKGAISDVQIEKLRVAPDTLKNINEVITKGLGIIELYKQFTGDKVDFTGKTEPEARQAVLEYLKKEREGTDKWRQSLADVDKGYREIATQAAKIKGLTEVVDDPAINRARQMTNGANPLSWMRYDDAMQDRNKINKDIGFYSEHPGAMTPDAMKDLAQRASEFGKNAPTGFGFDVEGINKSMEALKKILDLYEEIIKKKEAAAAMNVEGKAEQGQQHLNSLADARPITSIEEAAHHTEHINDLFKQADDANIPGFNRGLEEANDRLQEMKRNAEALKNAFPSTANGAATVPAGGGSMPNSAHGGTAWNFLADGGTPRGTDTLHAMLSPGEVVMNAHAARTFGAQLTAMNANVKPSYHSHGGSVTNVGDINVNVHGGGSDRNLGRTVATEIRRELRRGSSTLS